MKNIILNFIGGLILSFGFIYSWEVLINKKIKYNKIFTYIIIFALTVAIAFNATVANKMIKIISSTIILALAVVTLFKENIKNSIILAFYVQLINIIDEAILSILLVFALGQDLGMYSTFIVFIANIWVAILSIFIVNLKFIKKTYQNIIKIASQINSKRVLLFLIPIIVIFNIYLSVAYYKYDALYLIIANTITLLFISVIIFEYLSKQNQYLKISEKYNKTIFSLKEYERILNVYRIQQHENKNNLLTIRGMLQNKEQKAKNYIDEMLKSTQNDDETVEKEISVIPTGGLRGLIYSKIITMKLNNIKYYLNISNQVKCTDFLEKINDDDMFDICQILGVFLDNSIDEVLKIDNGFINIEIYYENNSIIFSISNNYLGEIQIDKIEYPGYSTKGNSRGYGLSLVKEIISKNNRLENTKKITSSTFHQILKIKM